jgi:hypothetical protein
LAIFVLLRILWPHIANQLQIKDDKLKIKIALILPAIILTGCATAVQTWTPPNFKQDLQIVEATVAPACGNIGCYGFAIALTNKTDKPIEIDWNRSYYTQGGQTNGGLMNEGVIIAQRNMLRPPDVIFPNGVYLKTVWPSNYMFLSAGLTTIDWISQMLPEGQQGIYLTLKQGDHEEYLRAEMFMRITYTNLLPGLSAGGVNLINADK